MILVILEHPLKAESRMEDAPSRMVKVVTCDGVIPSGRPIVPSTCSSLSEVQLEKAFEPAVTETVFGMTADARFVHPLNAFAPRERGVKTDSVAPDWVSDAVVFKVS